MKMQRMIVEKSKFRGQITEMPDWKKTRVLFPCGAVVYFPYATGLEVDNTHEHYLDMKAEAEFVKANVPETYLVED